MSAWMAGLFGLLPALAVPILYGLRGTVVARIVAVQLATAVAGMALITMSFAFGQDSYTSLAIGLCLANTVGTLVVATAVERWL